MLVNLRSFKQKVRYHKKKLKRYLGKIERNPPRNLDKFKLRQLLQNYETHFYN
jgi:hypothetical protein